jgi:hypothetical protein
MAVSLPAVSLPVVVVVARPGHPDVGP